MPGESEPVFAASRAGELVGRCLDLLEREGSQRVEALLADHPAEAEEVRLRLHQLSELGSADTGPQVAALEQALERCREPRD